MISPENIDPNNTNWVINGGGDNLQHYLGWRFFRNSSWTRYLLFMRDLNYPIGSSVIVMDSNPLFCLIFKLLRGILPEQFQFNGIWLLTSWLLLGIFSALIGWRVTKSVPLTAAGSVLCILNPVILQRALIHDTLTAHWLILAAIWLFLNDEKKWNSVGWFLLTELTLLIHVYFIPMIAFILLLQVIRMVINKIDARKILIVVIVFGVSLLLGYFGLGYNYIQPQTESYGELSMNLNAFINPDGVSIILSDRPKLSLQYEGFNYLGAGMLLLLIFGMITGRLKILKTIYPYILPTFALILLAASNIGYFDLQRLWTVQLPDMLSSFLSVFRSSGRLVWPVYYLLLFVSLAFISRAEANKNLLCGLVFVCTAVQGFDLNGFIAECYDRFRLPQNSVAVLPPDLTDLIPENGLHLYVSTGNAKITDALALYAADHHMTCNLGTGARGIKHIYGGDIPEFQSLTCNQIHSDDVWIYLENEEVPTALFECSTILIQRTGEFTVITSK